MSTPERPRGTVLKNLFLVAFFGLQLAAAVPGFVYDKHETRGNFSWNMYATRHQCSIRYGLVTKDGKLYPIEHEQAFNRPDRAHIVFHRDTLPAFHRFMCEEIGSSEKMSRIHGRVECRIDGRDRQLLVHQDDDICTAPNYGVR
jgi:hypothetical protein